MLALICRDQATSGATVADWSVHVMLLAALVAAGYVFRDRLLLRPPEISDLWLFGTPTSAAAVGLGAYGAVRRVRLVTDGRHRLRYIRAS